MNDIAREYFLSDWFIHASTSLLSSIYAFRRLFLDLLLGK